MCQNVAMSGNGLTNIVREEENAGIKHFLLSNDFFNGYFT